MCQKLVICRYIGFNPDNELCTVGKKYSYFIETKKKVEKGDFICIAENFSNRNDDKCFLSVVRVMEVVDDYKHNIEKGNELIAGCESEPRRKIFVGKADCGTYFAELDKKRKREELKDKIEKRFREAEKEALYRKLAETDPVMQSLLQELDSIK